MRVKLTVLAITTLLVVAGSLSGQTLGEISGYVRDVSGGLLSGAEITAINQATNQTRTTRTNETGGYVIPLLLPGQYTVTASLPGFQAKSTTGVEVDLGAQVHIDVELQVGSIEETVEVVGDQPLVQRDNATISTVISQQQLVDFPTRYRNYLSLLKLSSNVATDMGVAGLKVQRQGGERSEQAIAVAGQRQESNRFTLDGIENTDVNFNTFLVRPSIDALQQVKIQTGIYSAQYGRSLSQIIVGTKSGTNQFHGTIFGFHTNDHLNAEPWRFEGEQSPFATNQFGFTFGGPLVKNRLFFFSNAELVREQVTSQTNARVPGNDIRTGDFSGQPWGVFDPLTRVFDADGKAVSAEPFPNQVIPQSRQHPIALALLEFYPQATTTNPGFNYLREAFHVRDSEQYLQRFDFQESPVSSWFGRFSHGNERSADPARPFPTQTSRSETRAYQWMASNTRSLSPRALNELRVGYNRFDNDVVNHFAFQRDVVSELGIRGLTAPDPSAWGVPRINLDHGWTRFGRSFSGGPWSGRDRTLQVINNTSIVTGAHSIKMGGEFRRDHYNQLGAHLATGNFSFFGDATADPSSLASTGESFADFLIGATGRASRISAFYDAKLRANSVAFYLQDTWRLTPRLTIDLGIRYEYTPPYHDNDRGIINAQVFDMGAGPDGLLADTQTPILTRPGSGDFYEGLEFRYDDAIPTQVGDQFMGRRLVADDRNDWAPRLGIAFSPSNRWTIRSGAGMFYSQDIGNARFEMSRNLSGRDRFDADPQRPDSDLSDPWASSVASASCTGWDGVCLQSPFLFNNIFGRRTPYVFQWMFDVQRQLTDSILVQVGYHGNGGHKLERMRPFNQAVNRSGPDDGSSLTSRRPWPEYGTVQEVDSVGNSNYHALNLKLESRLSHGATFLVRYTWSKAIDDTSAIRNPLGDRLYPANNYNLQAERGLSQFHAGSRFAASFIYELPFGPGRAIAAGNGVLGKALEGWQLSSILSVSEGSPNHVTGIGFRNNTGVLNYPDATGISPIIDAPTPERYWNVEAFDTTNPELSYRHGTVGRSHLTNPGLVNWDFSLLKNVAISETQRLQLRFEAYNLANHPNWTSLARDARRSTFGQVGAARAMRSIQLGVKYMF